MNHASKVFKRLVLTGVLVMLVWLNSSLVMIRGGHDIRFGLSATPAFADEKCKHGECDAPEVPIPLLMPIAGSITYLLYRVVKRGK